MLPGKIASKFLLEKRKFEVSFKRIFLERQKNISSIFHDHFLQRLWFSFFNVLGFFPIDIDVFLNFFSLTNSPLFPYEKFLVEWSNFYFFTVYQIS